MHQAFRPAWAGRLARLAGDLEARGLDAFVVTQPQNITYLSGFRGSSGMLLVSGDLSRGASATGDLSAVALAKVDALLLADGRYHQAIREGLREGRLGPVQLEPVERGYDRALATCLSGRGYRRVGLESGHVTIATLDGWRRVAPPIEWAPIEGLIEQHRAVKDEGEIATLRAGARAISDVASALGEHVVAGRSELEVARAIDRALERAGFSAPAFPTIVASGPNSALPHARPTERRLTAGDLVLLDFGGVLDGYCVDLTRMAAVGPVAPELLALFDAVREAQVAAFAAVRSGVAASMVDAAARDVLEARGYGKAFVHSTGHGLGLDVHEAPRIGRAPEPDEPSATPPASVAKIDTLAAGMVCTIEPGAYLDGLGGVRLEDDVLVTAGGCEVLTTAPRELMVV
jgi:Xaa-Pro aminopeptidase